MEKLCLTQFSAKIYFNRNLAASDVFQMFAQSIQFYICFCDILKITDIGKN